MIDATVVVPTYRHAALLPYAIRSVLAQEGAAIELFVVGDGVEDDTRETIEDFLRDERVRFFDFPKGERHGELGRHEALESARGRVVCYLSDDDLFFPDHVSEMLLLLEDADFAHSAPLVVMPDGLLRYGSIDVARPEFHAFLLRGDWNRISLSGTAHTLESYRRLPDGWRPAPANVWSDLYMWQQFVRQPWFRGRTGTRLTHIHLPDRGRRQMSVAERVAELEGWWDRIHKPGFAVELERMVADAVREEALTREARVHELEDAVWKARDTVRQIQSTRWWRLRTRLATSAPYRALRSRRTSA